MDTYQSAKEDVKRSADIIDLIGQFVQLKKTGQNYSGLCPFHSEKAPSFTVSPARQMFHCFGCKKGGDIFAFWMEYHKVSFPQALRDLAGKYQIPLPTRNLSPAEKRKKELKDLLFIINQTAAEYFHSTLIKSAEGGSGRKYLEKRSVSKDIISEYKLGYAPDMWDGLTRFLKSKKIEMEKAVIAGLLIQKKNGGYYDRFRGRIIFPIFNLRNKIIGFGGRVLDDSLPKYLNTPETPVFQKGELLYGLSSAYSAIRESGRAVIVEGYTDVLGLRRHGFNQAVATLGTALTKDHVRKLKGYAGEVVIVFDSDEAGKRATARSLPIFLNEGVSSRVMVLPEGEDPDSFVNKNGLDSFLDNLNRSIPMFEFFVDQKLSYITDGVEDKVNVLKEILPVLSGLNDTVQCSLYVQQLSENMGITESVILTELRNFQAHHSGKGNKRSIGEQLSSTRSRNKDGIHLLNLFINYPHTMESLMQVNYKALFSDTIMAGLFDSLYEIYKNEGKIEPEDILDRLGDDQIKEQFREAILLPSIYPSDTVEDAINEFKDRIQKLELSQSFNKAIKRRDMEELNQLLKLKKKRTRPN